MAPDDSHRSHRVGWLRAGVLGANDGLISTSSLLVGVASANSGRHEILLAGFAALAAGALSMAAGEYVSVSTQSDTERADLAIERRELAADPVKERAELATIYVSRGLTPDLAATVADQLMAHDDLAAHARDELGFSDRAKARPLQAAVTSAAAFGTGALLPLLLAALTPLPALPHVVIAASLVLLAVLGAIAARLGGASIANGALRVVFWGALAMGCTAIVGRWFGAATP